jgi:hypothetical protein
LYAAIENIEGDDKSKIWVCPRTFSDVAKTNNATRQICGLPLYAYPEVIQRHITQVKAAGKMPVVIRWTYTLKHVEYDECGILSRPLQYLGQVNVPYTPPAQTNSSVGKKKRTMVLEKDLESDLLKWIHSRGFDAENQISTSKHRMDIWIPGKCFLELKRGRVSGDDICQAIDYCAEYKLPVIVVGNHINSMASRGAEAFNKAVDGEMLIFVQWSAVKTYLKGLFSGW